jgi:hypothetical protein
MIDLPCPYGDGQSSDKIIGILEYNNVK